MTQTQPTSSFFPYTTLFRSDPDSLVRKEGKQGLEDRINKSIHLPEFLFNHLKQQVDVDSLHGKARLDQLAAPLIYRLPDRKSTRLTPVTSASRMPSPA